ncbi:MAG: tannase/feruloyl esterase family alpha/beta hydrolase [Clostridia bacterium]|nr:tannase/feruloyl esterase family alpha/beta hydrolase [Clostridia bacterium]
MNREVLAELPELQTELCSWDICSGYFTAPNGESYEGLPSFLRMELVSCPGEGSRIRHEVWLPTDWNGIFVGTGNGGLAGNIAYGSLVKYVKQGYAVANTDMGTQNGRERGIGNPDVHKDFGWRATWLMTRAGKALVKAQYYREAKKSYFIGCSTGGQQALVMAQRFPEEYDGIIAGVPANNRTQLHTYFLWNHRAIKDAGVTFTKKEVEKISALAADFMKNVRYAPRGDEESIQKFIAYLTEKTELSDTKLKVLEKIYRGPVNPRTGERIYNGMPMGSERFGCGILDHQMEEAPHFYPFIWTFGADYTGDDFDFDRDLDRVNALLAPDLNANDPDLTPFLERGGKLLFYSGSADPCVPFPDAMAYYDRVMKANGKRGRQQIRYFLLPGEDHGADFVRYGRAHVNGHEDVRDSLEIMRYWVEEGRDFDQIETRVQSGWACLFDANCPEGPRKIFPTCHEHYLEKGENAI